MLIKLNKLNIATPVKGIIHVGAHECEERADYINQFNLTDNNIVWIEALSDKVEQIKNHNKNIIIFNECIGDVDGKTVSFIVTNNYQSSSFLELKTQKYNIHIYTK